MPSMSAPSDASVPVWHYDGVSGVRRAPLMVARGDGFVLIEHGAEEGPFAFADLTAMGPREFGLRKRPGWRIGLDEAPPEAIAARLPGARRYGGVIDRIGLWPAAIGFALLSAVVLFAVTSAPALLVRFVPRSAEERMGQLMVGDFGGRACSTPRGNAALTALATRLGRKGDVTDIRVVDLPMVNAVALPGGHVVLFNGLLVQARDPDEVAGVLAHEMGHVAHRDVLEALVRQLGLSVVLGGLDGNVGGYTNVLLSAGYSRGAESRADGFAIAALDRARVSPKGTAAFFDRLSKLEIRTGKAAALLGYVSSHPMSAERKARFAASAKGAYTPALGAPEWQALRDICAGRSSREQFRF